LDYEIDDLGIICRDIFVEGISKGQGIRNHKFRNSLSIEFCTLKNTFELNNVYNLSNKNTVGASVSLIQKFVINFLIN